MFFTSSFSSILNCFFILHTERWKVRNIREVSNSILWIIFQLSTLLSRQNIFRLLDKLFNCKLCNLHKNYESPLHLPYTHTSPLHSMKIFVIMPHGVPSTMTDCVITQSQTAFLRRILPSVSYFWPESPHFREFSREMYTQSFINYFLSLTK